MWREMGDGGGSDEYVWVRWERKTFGAQRKEGRLNHSGTKRLHTLLSNHCLRFLTVTHITKQKNHWASAPTHHPPLYYKRTGNLCRRKKMEFSAMFRWGDRTSCLFLVQKKHALVYFCPHIHHWLFHKAVIN